MKSSGISSAKAARQPFIEPLSTPQTRKTFALTAPSVRLDPRTHAVRGDLADVRLADQVFAPHYAAPIMTVARQAATMFADRHRTRALFDLAAGERFEMLDLAGDHAWGRAPDRGLVGYVDRAALDVPA